MTDRFPNTPDTPASVRHLEEVVQHQERHIQDLSDMVARQWQEIDLLKKMVQAVQKKLVAVAAADMDDEGREGMSVTEIALRDKPPHY